VAGVMSPQFALFLGAHIYCLKKKEDSQAENKEASNKCKQEQEKKKKLFIVRKLTSSAHDTSWLSSFLTVSWLCSRKNQIK
jgi:hypothetical protein